MVSLEGELKGAEADAEPTGQALYLLRRVAALADRAISRALEPFGLTVGQFAVLEIMGEAHDQSLGCTELGRRLAGPSPDVTRLLDRLESVALVSRERDREDRRVVHTRISEKGRQLLLQAAPEVRAAESRALAGLPLEDQRQLARMLAVVQQNFPGN